MVLAYATNQVYAACDKDETVMKYLDKPDCLDRPLGKFEDVIMHSFRGSKSELFFIKLLFARAPSLFRMNIKQGKAPGSRERRNISKELMRFSRAFPRLSYSIRQIQISILMGEFICNSMLLMLICSSSCLYIFHEQVIQFVNTLKLHNIRNSLWPRPIGIKSNKAQELACTFSQVLPVSLSLRINM